MRVLLAGILGGLFVFGGGAISHMFLELESRAIRPVGDERAAGEFLDRHAEDAGIYGTPMMNPDAEDMNVEYERINELYKKGPSAFIVVAPRGEDMMGPMQLGGEAVFDVLAALTVAFIVSRLSPQVRLFERWFIVMLFGLAAWATISTSWALWYRFPWLFILDGLYVALIEWALAGLVIAALVRPARIVGRRS